MRHFQIMRKPQSCILRLLPKGSFCVGLCLSKLVYYSEPSLNLDDCLES